MIFPSSFLILRILFLPSLNKDAIRHVLQILLRLNNLSSIERRVLFLLLPSSSERTPRRWWWWLIRGNRGKIPPTCARWVGSTFRHGPSQVSRNRRVIRQKVTLGDSISKGEPAVAIRAGNGTASSASCSNFGTPSRRIATGRWFKRIAAFGRGELNC